jgi:PLP dependent protein
MNSSSLLREKIVEIKAAINTCSSLLGRNSRDIKVVAATKRQKAEIVNCYIEHVNSYGEQALVGESYLQELQAKLPNLKGDFLLHFIGRLQSNKINRIVEICDTIQSVGSFNHLDSIYKWHKKLPNANLKNIFLQMNVSKDTKKSGFLVEDLDNLFNYFKDPNKIFLLSGVMTITELYDEPFSVKKDFGILINFSKNLSYLLKKDMKVSMGMSSDFLVAISEGSDMVRLGSALFG